MPHFPMTNGFNCVFEYKVYIKINLNACARLFLDFLFIFCSTSFFNIKFQRDR